VTVSVARRSRQGKISVGKIKKTALKVLELLHQSRAELSVALVGNREIQGLNSRYRAKDEPTDVLSFTSGEILPGGALILGDVVISLEKAGKQARAARRTLEKEVETLLVHGILHLLGYDHERSSEEARIMRALERKIARSLVRSTH
jgi:probable rRNA maturation factor